MVRLQAQRRFGGGAVILRERARERRDLRERGCSVQLGVPLDREHVLAQREHLARCRLRVPEQHGAVRQGHDAVAVRLQHGEFRSARRFFFARRAASQRRRRKRRERELVLRSIRHRLGQDDGFPFEHERRPARVTVDLAPERLGDDLAPETRAVHLDAAVHHDFGDESLQRADPLVRVFVTHAVVRPGDHQTLVRVDLAQVGQLAAPAPVVLPGLARATEQASERDGVPVPLDRILAVQDGEARLRRGRARRGHGAAVA